MLVLWFCLKQRIAKIIGEWVLESVRLQTFVIAYAQYTRIQMGPYYPSYYPVTAAIAYEAPLT